MTVFPNKAGKVILEQSRCSCFSVQKTNRVFISSGISTVRSSSPWAKTDVLSHQMERERTLDCPIEDFCLPFCWWKSMGLSSLFLRWVIFSRITINKEEQGGLSALFAGVIEKMWWVRWSCQKDQLLLFSRELAPRSAQCINAMSSSLKDKAVLFLGAKRLSSQTYLFIERLTIIFITNNLESFWWCLFSKGKILGQQLGW